ncbi:MAG: GHKL domain-containing protein, partial [Armatimonadetes bacterium]|nr:GHKL domain-containing protein [Armatimonadota bacterium]
VETDVALPTQRSLHARITPVSDREFLLVLRDLTELRRLERVRRDFVANVSHELRTPLTSIKAMAETLLDGARLDESVAGRFLETIIRESDRLVRLSSDLLDLSRVEARGPNKEEIDLAALVTEVAARFAAPAQKAGVSLTNRAAGPLRVMADRDEMAQVLVNLLDNAITYTPRGGSVTVTASETPEAVTVAVADTGIGILSHDIRRLFERFYRADKARSRASGGTGLGLSIVKHIVENHGGTVGVESEYNKGSTFTFTLPK